MPRAIPTSRRCRTCSSAGMARKGKTTAFAFHAFDLLELNGEDLTRQPNIERRERLEALLKDAKPPIHVADHVIGAGEKLFRAMCEAGQEGIISKRDRCALSGRADRIRG